MLVLIAANRSNFKLNESRAAMNTIRRYAAEDAHIIYGAAYDENLGDQLRVTVIATGLSRARPQIAPLTVVQPQATLRTGTDNLPVLHDVARPGQPHQSHQSQVPQSSPTDFSSLSTPSVWRSARTSAAARVEALSSNGMEEIEIPAFLRKQAD